MLKPLWYPGGYGGRGGTIRQAVSYAYTVFLQGVSGKKPLNYKHLYDKICNNQFKRLK
jgi:hypothetical protein